MASLLRFHHLGLLTHQPSLAAALLECLGYRLDKEICDPLQLANLRMAYPPGTEPLVEIIHPHDANEGLKRLLKRRDDHIYHMCYTTPNLNEALQTLSSGTGSINEVSPPKPAVLFDGKKVSFYVAEGFGLLEIIAE